jgi:hypothetical protein
VNPITALRFPFLTHEQAAFFLQLPVVTARWMCEEGQLPRALRLDGGVFEPVPGRVLIPYEDFKPLLKGEAAVMLRLWQRGSIELPKPTSSMSPARPFRSVVYRGNGRRER